MEKSSRCSVSQETETTRIAVGRRTALQTPDWLPQNYKLLRDVAKNGVRRLLQASDDGSTGTSPASHGFRASETQDTAGTDLFLAVQDLNAGSERARSR